MKKCTRIFLMVIALIVITDCYAGVDDGLDKLMNQEPVTQQIIKPKPKPKKSHLTIKHRAKTEKPLSELEKVQRAAEKGDDVAQYNLGIMYANGLDVDKDDEQAVLWFRKAAEQGFASAQFNLGVMYLNGLGVDQDEDQAIEWFTKAAEQGHEKAQFNLAVLFAKSKAKIKK